MVYSQSKQNLIVCNEANSILRHFPSEYDLDMAAEKAPFVFQKHMEPLYRMVKQYDMEKKGEAE